MPAHPIFDDIFRAHFGPHSAGGIGLTATGGREETASCPCGSPPSPGSSADNRTIEEVCQSILTIADRIKRSTP
jgi:hypothetical protein